LTSIEGLLIPFVLAIFHFDIGIKCVGGVCVHLFILIHSLLLTTAFSQYHASQFPILARMARDYLAIQGLSVPSEHAFSSSGLTGTLHCNQLDPETFEALQILKSGYKNGLMDAREGAAAYEEEEWSPDV